MTPREFDRVKLRDVEGTMSREEFLALPLARRIRHLLAGDIEFFLGSEPVEWRSALAWLRERDTRK